MARKANTLKTLTITAGELHLYDYIVGTRAVLVVDEVTRRNGEVVVRFWSQGQYANDFGIHKIDARYLVTVKTEHECDCNGTGRFRWAGRVENGVYIGKEGPHFACDGKGWQSRSDVIRNATYWAKYARIYA